jgi:ABC-2 type transport system permease protein
VNRALWKKAVHDGRTQLLVSSGLLLLFGWVFVWLVSLFKMGAWTGFLNLLPDFVERLAGVPLAEFATVAGRLSFLYIHVIPLLTCIGWAVGRGSDTVSGGISSGHLELVLTLPIRRTSALFVSAVVMSLGAIVLPASLWLGHWLGLRTVDLGTEISGRIYLPAAINLFAMTFALAGITTLISSWDHDRWRTIWATGGFFIVSTIIKMVARLWEAGAWLKYLSFLSAFEPQMLVLARDKTGSLSWWYNGSLLALGVVCYGLAMIVFARRDIPVPR